MSRRHRFRRARAAATCAVLLGGVGACGHPPVPDFPRFEVAVPAPEDVEEVLFLVGDAGETEAGRSPILRDLGERIEYWSGAIARDSAVTVLFLGDNVYPAGVHDRDTPAFEEDSMRLWNQIDLIAGTEARRRGTLGLFLTGNHDWGNMQGAPGIRRLENEAALIDGARAGGVRVRLVPQPTGSPGPEVIDLRSNTRIIAIGSPWFLQSTVQRERDEFMTRVLTAIEEAEDRHVIMAAHHPWASAGPHGVMEPVGNALGLPWLLKKSGTLVQDLNSPIYIELRRRLETAFIAAERPPLAFVAGHDHSLQVIEGDSTTSAPRFQLVSGAGSKATAIQEMEALKWGSAHLGFMMLFFLKNEAAQLFVVATDSDVTVCPPDPPERDACLDEEAERFQLRYSELLAPPASLPETAAGTAARGPAVDDEPAAAEAAGPRRGGSR